MTFILNKMEWASKASKCSEWKGRKNRANFFSPLHIYGRGVIHLCVCPSVCLCVSPWGCLCFGKSLITFELMDQFGQNFQGLFGGCLVAMGWVVPMPSPHPVGLGLHPVLFPVVYLLHGHWCYQIMTYNFGKHLTRQTNKCEQILILALEAQLHVTQTLTMKGIINFCELANIS